MNTACQRCRKRKIKCDLESPRCGNCTRANVRCVCSELTSSRATSSLPPGYLESLEAEVALLEAQATRALSSTSPGQLVSASGQNAGIDGRFPEPPDQQCPSFDWSSIGEGDSNRLHPTFAYGLDYMFQSAVAVDNRFPYHSRQRNLLFPRMTQDRTLGYPQVHPLSQMYLDTFLSTVQECLPILQEADIARFRTLINGAAHIESSVLQITLSIGAMLTPGNDAVSSYHAIDLFGAAINTCNPTTADLQTLQVFILATIFSLFHSAAGSTWHLLGLAVQVAVSLGLHHKQGAQSQLSDLAFREDLFWIIYVLDRLVSIPLGRPVGIHDSDISTKVPEDRPETTCLHVLTTLAKMASLKRDSQLNQVDAAKDCYSLLPQRVHGHGSSLFKTFAFQLAVWTAADPQKLQQNMIQGNHKSDGLLQPHVSCMTYFQAEVQQQTPMPWTSAYAIFHAAVLTRSALGLQAMQHDDQWNLQTGLGPEDPSLALQTVPGQLSSFSRMFRGLKDLAELYDQITSPQRGQTTPRNWEVLGNRYSRDAVRLLVGLRKSAPLPGS